MRVATSTLALLLAVCLAVCSTSVLSVGGGHAMPMGEHQGEGPMVAAGHEADATTAHACCRKGHETGLKSKPVTAPTALITEEAPTLSPRPAHGVPNAPAYSGVPFFPDPSPPQRL